MLQDDEYEYKGLTLDLGDAFILGYNIVDENGENKGVNGSQLLPSLEDEEIVEDEHKLFSSFVFDGKEYLGLVLNNISNLTYDTSILNNVIYTTTENDIEQKIRFYKKFNSVDGLMFKEVKIPIVLRDSANNIRKYDTINYIQWREQI